MRGKNIARLAVTFTACYLMLLFQSQVFFREFVELYYVFVFVQTRDGGWCHIILVAGYYVPHGEINMG